MEEKNVNTKLEFLESLSPEEQVRYKAFSSSSISPSTVEELIGNMLPPMISDQTKLDIFTTVSIASKAFAVQLIENAVEIQSTLTSPGETLEPGCILEAYRRMLLEGRIPGANTVSKEATISDTKRSRTL